MWDEYRRSVNWTLRKRRLNMLKKIQKRFALSRKGAEDFCKGTVFTILLDLALMLPFVFVFLFLDATYVRR